jgi:hypothetical protein
LQQRPRNGRSSLNQKAKVRNPKVSYLISILIYLKLNVLTAISWDIMQEIAGVLLLSRKEEEDSKPQLPLKRLNPKRSLKEDKLGLPPKSKNNKEYYLISALSGTITKLEEIWLIDSGASRHMTGFKQNLANYHDKKFKAKVELGDDGTYDIKGFGSTSFQFHSGNIFHIDEILYVPGLKKNLISVLVLESKGYSIAFSKGKALLWS